MKRWCIIALALATVGCGQRFDLTCKGTQIETGGSHESKIPKNWSELYKFDLKAKKFCSGKCEEAYPIKSLSDSEIHITRFEGTEYAEDTTINRESGHLSSTNKFFESLLWQDGTCTKAAFTGLPKAKF